MSEPTPTSQQTADPKPAELLCDRHPADAVAFTVVEPNLTRTDLTYGWLKDRSERAAAAFAALGIKPGDRVATLMGKGADLVATLVGLWRLGAVHVPLFTAFAPPAIEARLGRSGARFVVADAAWEYKLEGIEASLGLTIVVAGPVGSPESLDLNVLIDDQAPGFPAAVCSPEDPLVEIFTSGTTGMPKAVPVPAKALEAFAAYLHYGLDVQEDDVFWNVADPGWAYGLYYGILAPLYAGRRNHLLRGGFEPELCWRVLKEFGITNFAGAPTIFRSLRAARPDGVGELAVHRASSAGEPLDADTIAWSAKHLGAGVRDHYGQTEMGMCIVNCWHEPEAREVRPGSMGFAMPGFTSAVLERDADVPAAPGVTGRVALDVPASPLFWFQGYTNDPDRTAERFSADGRWYYTGDTGRVDEDGYTYFSARDDDVIIMAGYRIGPFEIESVLAEHPEVLECAVVGAPDELRGEVVVAYVVLRDPAAASEDLERELQQLVKQRHAAHSYPRRVHFVESLPKTPSGKLQRFLLRAAERS
jgi:acetyl-CoA synthetase